jgi:hypothetical protein
MTASGGRPRAVVIGAGIGGPVATVGIRAAGSARLVAARSLGALPWAGELTGPAGRGVLICDPDREAEADVSPPLPAESQRGRSRSPISATSSSGAATPLQYATAFPATRAASR